VTATELAPLGGQQASQHPQSAISQKVIEFREALDYQYEIIFNEMLSR
jgi:hypothetical protein